MGKRIVEQNKMSMFLRPLRILTILVFLPIIAHGETYYGELLCDGLSWLYEERYCSEQCMITGLKELNGKTYGVMSLESPVFWDGARGQSVPRRSLERFTVGVRDEGGRILVDKEEYLNLLNQIVECEDWSWFVRSDSLPYETTVNGELIIYDFTKKQGEVYCQMADGTALTVVKAEVLNTEDGISRRHLTLSNGYELIEGVGCVNSQGMLLFWLNPKSRNKNTVLLTSYGHRGADGQYTPVLARDYNATVSPNKLLRQNRRWVYDYDNGQMKGTLTYTIKGDTLLNAYRRSKIYMTLKDNATNKIMRSGFIGMINERQDTIFLRTPDTPKDISLYYFTESCLSTFKCGETSRYVVNTDKLTIGENTYSRMLLVNKEYDGALPREKDSLYCWVDGIGSSKGFLDTHTGILKDSIKFVACYDGEECLFTNEDFWKDSGQPSKFKTLMAVDSVVYYLEKSTLSAVMRQPIYGASLGDIVVPYSINLWGDEYVVNEIAKEAFSLFPHVGPTSIVLPDGVVKIGEKAFWGCSDLTSVVLPSRLKTIENAVFANCENLQSVKLPDSLETVGPSAFSNTRLTTVDLPATIVSVEKSAFAYCTSLMDVYCRSTSVPHIEDTAFRRANPEATLHVPASLIEAYKKAATWKDFKYIVPINDIDGITSPKVPIYNYQFFDLQGRPVQGSPNHGVYIQDGKKVMR